MQIFIDESGNLGKKDRYFVISAFIPSNTKRIKNIIKRCCVRFYDGKGALFEIKGCTLKLPERQDFINRLNVRDDFRIAYIVADKNHIKPELLKRKNVCFNYLMMHLMKPIFKTAEEDIEIFMDNRTVKVASANSLKEYLQIEAYSKLDFSANLKLDYYDSKIVKNLQAADVVANTIYQKYERGYEHSYGLLRSSIRYGKRFPQHLFGRMNKIDKK